jgi:hypothetical protein
MIGFSNIPPKKRAEMRMAIVNYDFVFLKKLYDEYEAIPIGMCSSCGSSIRTFVLEWSHWQLKEHPEYFKETK